MGRGLRHLAQPLRAEAHDPGVGADDGRRDAVEGADLPDRLRAVVVEVVAPSRRARPSAGRKGAIVTPAAPHGIPIEQCGDENVLWRLNWQRSKPASLALVIPRMPFAFAWS